MRKYRNRIIAGLVLALAIYAVVLLVFDNQGQFGEGVGEALAQFPWVLLLPLTLTQVVANAFRFAIWQYYLGVIEARDKISTADSAVVFVSSFMMVVSPGKAAELLKSVFLKMKTGVPFTRSAPIVVVERLVDGVAVIIILTLTLLFAGDRLQLGEFLGLSRVIIFSSAAVIISGLLCVQIRPLAYLVLNLINRLPLVRRLHPALIDLYESTREILQPRHIIPATLLGTGVYLSSVVCFTIVLMGFGLSVTWILILQAAFIVGITSAIGALSFVPNGAGITEVSNVALLTTLVAPVNPLMTVGVAAAASLIQGFFHKWLRVVVGMLVALIYRKRLFTPGIEAEVAAMEAPQLSVEMGQR